MNPALEVGIAALSAMSAAVGAMALYLISDLKGDIREIRDALGLGGKHVRIP